MYFDNASRWWKSPEMPITNRSVRHELVEGCAIKAVHYLNMLDISRKG